MLSSVSESEATFAVDGEAAAPARARPNAGINRSAGKAIIRAKADAAARLTRAEKAARESELQSEREGEWLGSSTPLMPFSRVARAFYYSQAMPSPPENPTH